MSIVPLRSDGPLARRLLAAAGMLALTSMVPADRLAAQAPASFSIPDSLVFTSASGQVTTFATPGCLSLRVVPGDTAGRTMPRSPGDTLADPRMPRVGSVRPPCEPSRRAAPAVAQRLFRMPDGTYRPIPTPKGVAPPRP